MRVRKIGWFFVLFFVLLVSNVYANFIPLEWDIRYDPREGIVNFGLTFSEPINFYTTKQVVNTGIQANEFQFLVFKDKNVPLGDYPSAEIESIITGSRIFESNGINVYAPFSEDTGDFKAGMWSKVLTEGIPYISSENYVDFNIPIEYLGGDSNFSYSLQTCEYGTQSFYEEFKNSNNGNNGNHYGQLKNLSENKGSNAVPEPATMSLLGMGLFGLLFKKRKV